MFGKTDRRGSLSGSFRQPGLASANWPDTRFARLGIVQGDMADAIAIGHVRFPSVFGGGARP
jgi:hypothetical protein